MSSKHQRLVGNEAVVRISGVIEQRFGGKADGDQLIVRRKMVQLEHGFDGGSLARPLYEKASMRKVPGPADRPPR